MFLIYIARFSNRTFTNKIFRRPFCYRFFVKQTSAARRGGGTGVSIVIRSISKNNYRRQ